MKHLIVILVLLLPISTYAQTGIGTTTPDASAQLEVSSTTKGFLPPRMTAEQRDAIIDPADGLVIFQINGDSGLYVRVSGAWVKINISNGSDNYWSLDNDDLVSSNSDVLVRSSLGVGSDITPSLDFGFNTIVLSENNLRILFDDTSSPGPFPFKDWRLTANDATSGGENYFSIDNVTDNLVGLKLKDNGDLVLPTSAAKLGVGTSDPIEVMHLKAGNSPGLRFEQDTSDGYTEQVWNVAANETNFFIRDVTNGVLPFKVQPNTPHNSLFIGTNGIGIRKNNPAKTLDVSGTLSVSEDVTFNAGLTISGKAFFNADDPAVGLIRISGGNPSAGKVLTAMNTSGDARWESPSIPPSANPLRMVYKLNIYYTELGGYVIELNSEGTHGLVVASQDQGLSNWYEVNEIMSDATKQDSAGAQFKDWRLPTRRELKLISLIKSRINTQKNGVKPYWSSSQSGFDSAWSWDFDADIQTQLSKELKANVLTVRAF